MTIETTRHQTGIQWTHVPGYIGATWNPTTGCTRVSPGCDHCYAFTLHDQRYATNLEAARVVIAEGRHLGLSASARTPGGQIRDVRREEPKRLRFPAQYDRPFSTVQMLDADRLEAPLRARKPRAYFVDSMADLFHEDVPDTFLDRVFAVMALSPRHVFMILTKRPKRMNAYFAAPERAASIEEACAGAFDEGGIARGNRLATERSIILVASDEPNPYWPLPNVWLGVSVEDQARAEERIPWLLDTPAAVRFLSCEPLLGPIVLQPRALTPEMGVHATDEALGDPAFRTAMSQLGRLVARDHMDAPFVDWVIAGGESGPRSRPMDLAWSRSLRDQCQAAGVPFFMKQLGAHPVLPLTEAGRDEWIVGRTRGDWKYRESAATSSYERDSTGARLGFLMSLKSRHGSDPAEWPSDLRVRQWPAAIESAS